MSARAVGTERSAETRELILTAAERLFAEHGVHAVSDRRIGARAGADVAAHFGSRAELVRAIVRRHAEPIERSRARMVAVAGRGGDVWDWVACLVRPFTEHLAASVGPSWYARFGSRVMAEPPLRRVVVDEALRGDHARRSVDEVARRLPALPAAVRLERGAMTRHLVTHTCAERERALATGAPTARSSWEDTATGLVAAIVGVWLAPVTS
ncbi:MAG: TetR family transcriptional regulator [Saccharothrix sp.]|nr:TetR family transcriptional regulator [Saccharothrix sp.]